jgi:hypothetical protein
MPRPAGVWRALVTAPSPEFDPVIAAFRAFGLVATYNQRAHACH